MIENFNPFISLGGDNQKVNDMAEAALEMNLTCNDLKRDLNLTDGDVVDMLQLVMDRFKNSNWLKIFFNKFYLNYLIYWKVYKLFKKK